MKYRCPHCKEVIEEVSVVVLTWKRVLVSTGLGIGCALLIFPLVKASAPVAATGAFIVAFLLVFLLTKDRK